MKECLIVVPSLEKMAQVLRTMKSIEEPENGPVSNICFWGDGEDDVLPWESDFFNPKQFPKTEHSICTKVKQLGDLEGKRKARFYGVFTPELFTDKLRKSSQNVEFIEDNIPEAVEKLFKLVSV